MNTETMMVRKLTYAGKVDEKDIKDILFWATEKTASERLNESWRLHCLNHNISFDLNIDKTKNKATLRSDKYI